MKQQNLWCLLPLLLVYAFPAAAAPKRLPRSEPEQVGMDSRQLARLDDVVKEGISTGEMPGCVVAIGRKGRLVILKAYGLRQVEPEEQEMTIDTVFDMASITKPVATATSVMLLVQRGRLRLSDRVATHIPEFGQNGKESITVEQLLTHQGGLLPDNSLNDYQDGPEKAFERICALSTRAEPGTRFIYSDVGFIVLAELVKRVSGENVHEFSQKNVFRPLGMDETGYLPPEALRARAATTEKREDRWMQGEVHDPRAYQLGGIAGHAGLFSTAEDLAVYAQMMLNRGRYGDARVLSPATVATMTADYQVSRGIRGLGWDKKTGYSSNRGDLMSARAFGHGGFTGTSLWIDPERELFVIFLSNRLHPDGKGTVNPLAGRIGAIATASLVEPTRPGEAVVLTGIDVLEREAFRPLAGKRVGLITNQTGINRQGAGTARLLHEAPNVQLAALFSPEHGLEGKLDIAAIADSRDPATGLKVYSLYGKVRAPTAEMLRDVDVLVFDIQDIGTRFYTFVSTMGNAMRAAAENKVPFMVLDRPNPINGVEVAGPLLDAGRESFVGFHRLPVRHGMTVGELASMFRQELQLDLQLDVIELENWRRASFFDATGLYWVNPSPNMRNLNQAILYPGIGLLETTNLSVGRGTDTPFEVVGAPWIDGPALAAKLNRSGLAGVRFVPVAFTPVSSKFAGERCGGVHILITRRDRFEPLRCGFQFAAALHELYPEDWELAAYDRLLCSRKTLDLLKSGKTPRELEAASRDDLKEFLARRSKFLRY